MELESQYVFDNDDSKIELSFEESKNEMSIGGKENSQNQPKRVAYSKPMRKGKEEMMKNLGLSPKPNEPNVIGNANVEMNDETL